jgi:hypothetical protein
MHLLFLSPLILLFSLFIPQKKTMIVGNEIIQIDSIGTVNYLSLKHENGFVPEKFEKFQIKNKTIFLNKSSGIVYERRNDSIVRIDNSYDDKIHNRSIDFVHRDTLFRFGGYGYFYNNKNLIFYDEKINEWDIINYKNSDLIEPFNNVGFHFIQDDKLHVFGYYVINDRENESQMVKKGFILDLNQREITKTFNLLDSFEISRSYFDLNNGYVLLINSQRKSFIVNKKTLEFYSYKLNPKENTTSYDSDFLIIKNQLYFESKDINMNFTVNTLNIESLIDNMKKEGYIIKSNWDFLFYVLMILSGLVVVFLMKKIFFKKKSISLNEKTLNYGRIKIELNDKMVEVLSLLLNQKKVSNSRLLDVFYVKNQNRIHINREKNNCIDLINLMFELKTNKQLIQKEKSLLDNRMIDYYINKDLI